MKMFVFPMKLSKSKKIYGPERARTADLLLAKQALYQLSYRPAEFYGGPKRNCTSDPSVISTVLY